MWEAGDQKQAIETEIAEIQTRYGEKYDEALRQMLDRHDERTSRPDPAPRSVRLLGVSGTRGHPRVPLHVGPRTISVSCPCAFQEVVVRRAGGIVLANLDHAVRLGGRRPGLVVVAARLRVHECVLRLHPRRNSR